MASRVSAKGCLGPFHIFIVGDDLVYFGSSLEGRLIDKKGFFYFDRDGLRDSVEYFAGLEILDH